MILVMPGCFFRNSMPAFTSRGMVSKRTSASLLSDRGFMHKTANPLLDSSVQARAFMKFDVRCITRIPTCGAVCEASGMYSAPLTEDGTPVNRTYRGLL